MYSLRGVQAWRERRSSRELLSRLLLLEVTNGDELQHSRQRAQQRPAPPLGLLGNPSF